MFGQDTDRVIRAIASPESLALMPDLDRYGRSAQTDRPICNRLEFTTELAPFVGQRRVRSCDRLTC